MSKTSYKSWPQAVETQAKAEIPLTPQAVRELRLGVKHDWQWSGRQLARELKISHTLLWLIERGERPIDENLAERIREIEKTWRKEAKQPRGRATVTVVSSFPLPRRLEILQVIRCRKCNQYFTPRRTGQVEHPRGMCRATKGRRRKKHGT